MPDDLSAALLARVDDLLRRIKAMQDDVSDVRMRLAVVETQTAHLLTVETAHYNITSRRLDRLEPHAEIAAAAPQEDADAAQQDPGFGAQRPAP